jgi:hypothetical protein
MSLLDRRLATQQSSYACADRARQERESLEHMRRVRDAEAQARTKAWDERDRISAEETQRAMDEKQKVETEQDEWEAKSWWHRLTNVSPLKKWERAAGERNQRLNRRHQEVTVRQQPSYHVW